MKHHEIDIKTKHDRIKFELNIYENRRSMFQGINRHCRKGLDVGCPHNNFCAMTIAGWNLINMSKQCQNNILKPANIAVFLTKQSTLYDVIHESEHVLQFALGGLYRKLCYHSRQRQENRATERLAEAMEKIVESINEVRYAQ